MSIFKKDRVEPEKTVEVYEKNAGNIAATARELGISRRTVVRQMKRLGRHKKPIAAGSVTGFVTKTAGLPKKGTVKRYILTSAQNNTHVHPEFWKNLQVLAQHYDAEILVGTYSYNQNAYGELSTKRGTFKAGEKELWYAEEVLPYISDERRELANGLVWCGEMNILPTATDPLLGLESYTGRKSAIFPHAKLAMRSIPTMQNEATKLNYTTGTVTQRNYIQKRAGLIAEHHHVYGALIVEVNHDGHWWVRQLNADNTDSIRDLDLLACNGVVTSGYTVEAITWGDLHAAAIEEDAIDQAMNMLDALRPKQQFMHDVLEGVSVSHHNFNNPHEKFKAYLRGLDRFVNELEQTKEVIKKYQRSGSKITVVYSNHDTPWVLRWLRENDYRKDPANAVLFLKTQLEVYHAMQDGDARFDPLEHLLYGVGLPRTISFLRPDESYTICDKKIECGMHGHLGPNGARGNPRNLQSMGRKANTAHTHSVGIFNGLYVAGISARLHWGYNQGPSSWTHSHIVTYPNGKRTIITMYNGAWRA